MVGSYGAPSPGRPDVPEAPPPTLSPSPTSAKARFRDLDEYRIEREWKRYEGTAQRDLFRQLRVRFLLRHAVTSGRAVELGPGPGRFTPYVGHATVRRVALDLSKGMLEQLGRNWDAEHRGPLPERVVADAVRPPLRPGAFQEVVALGNQIGFAGPEAQRLLREAVRLLAPGGTIILESVVDSGERSRYLARLPPGAVGRLLRSPVRLVRSRIEREGFELQPPRNPGRHGFRPVSPGEIRRTLRQANVDVVEAMAVAPALGFEAGRAEAVESDPDAWAHLLQIEEEIGRQPAHCDVAAALLVAGTLRP